jgi:hypothetical protein
MWLTLTTVQLLALDKRKPKDLTPLVKKSRINMSKINSYFEAGDEYKNHKSEDARFNTILDFSTKDAENTFAYYVKETVEEIDEMLNGMMPTIPLNLKYVQEKINELVTPNSDNSGWGNPKSGW